MCELARTIRLRKVKETGDYLDRWGRGKPKKQKSCWRFRD